MPFLSAICFCFISIIVSPLGVAGDDKIFGGQVWMESLDSPDSVTAGNDHAVF